LYSLPASIHDGFYLWIFAGMNFFCYPYPTPSPILDTVLFKNDRSIVIQKGTRFTHNTFFHYTNLSYYRLPPPPQQYTSLSLLSSIPIPKSPGEALSHPEMRCVPFKLVILRSWFLFRLSNQLLVLMVVYS